MTAPATPQPRRGIALALLAVSQFVVVLDASIVNVALPSIGEDLRFAQENLPWVVNAYVLTFGGFMLLGGRLADLLGRRRVFLAGLLLFALASLAGGLAESEGQLIAARAVQGLGAAILSPSALSIVTTMYREGQERDFAVGVWGAVAGSGGAAGVLLGGVLTDTLGWEWVLFVNVPIGLGAAALTPYLIRESRDARAGRSFDVAGAVTVTGGLTVLVFALVDATDAGWGSTQTVGLLALSAALLAAFVVVERGSRAPLVPFSFFRLRTVAGANVVALLVGAALFSMFFFVSLYMQQVLGYEPIEAGLAYLPLALTIVASAALASQLTSRFGFKPVMIAGLLLVAGGLVWFSRVSVGGDYVGDVLFPSLLAGAGLGLSFIPATIAAVSGGVRESDYGLASGLLNSAQQIGGALGLAILSTIATSRTDDVMRAARGAPEALVNALTEGFQSAFLAGAGLGLLGLAAALTLVRTRDSRAHARASSSR